MATKVLLYAMSNGMNNMAANPEAMKKNVTDELCRLLNRFQKACTNAEMVTKIMATGLMTRGV